MSSTCTEPWPNSASQWPETLARQRVVHSTTVAALATSGWLRHTGRHRQETQAAMDKDDRYVELTPLAELLQSLRSRHGISMYELAKRSGGPPT